MNSRRPDPDPFHDGVTLAAEGVVLDPDGTQRCVTLADHFDARRLLGGDVRVVARLAPNAAMIGRASQAGLPRNLLAERVLARRNELVGVYGPVLLIGVNASEEFETLPGEWRPPLAESGAAQC